MAINMRQDKKGTHAGKNIQLSVQKKLHCMKSVYELKFKKKSNYSYTRFICAEYISDEKHYSFDWLSVCSIHTNTGVTAVLLFWC